MKNTNHLNHLYGSFYHKRLRILHPYHQLIYPPKALAIYKYNTWKAFQIKNNPRNYQLPDKFSSITTWKLLQII